MLRIFEFEKSMTTVQGNSVLRKKLHPNFHKQQPLFQNLTWRVLFCTKFLSQNTIFKGQVDVEFSVEKKKRKNGQILKE